LCRNQSRRGDGKKPLRNERQPARAAADRLRPARRQTFSSRRPQWRGESWPERGLISRDHAARPAEKIKRSPNSAPTRLFLHWTISRSRKVKRRSWPRAARRPVAELIEAGLVPAWTSPASGHRGRHQGTRRGKGRGFGDLDQARGAASRCRTNAGPSITRCTVLGEEAFVASLQKQITGDGL